MNSGEERNPDLLRIERLGCVVLPDHREAAMQRAFYDLEDHLAYRAAGVRTVLIQRSLWALSLWAGMAGDLVGEVTMRRPTVTRHPD